MQDLTERSVYREDHEQFREQARRFFEREIVPHHAEWERQGIVPKEVWRKAEALGVPAEPVDGMDPVAVQAAAVRWGAERGPITILYRPARQPWLAKVMETARNRPGMLAVPTTLAGVRQMIKALRRGEAVGLLPDQVPPDGQGLWAPFFGRDAYTMTLAVRLAQQTGAAVVLVRCERLPWGRGFVTHFEPLAQPLSDQLDVAVVQINQAMEHLIRQCPEQYLWGYARYKQPRAEAAPAAGAAV